jgi:hypothetical protein
MTKEGPPLAPLLHRLADCPPEFLQVAPGDEDQGVDVVAIVCDLLRPLMPDRPPELASDLIEAIASRSQRQRMLTSIICWLLSDEWFVQRPELSPGICKLLTSGALSRLADLVRPDTFVSDPDRREELVRRCLSELGLRPQGETSVQAADRLTTLDSAERDRVLRATAAAERRAREIREAMARKQAQEAASRYGE